MHTVQKHCEQRKQTESIYITSAREHITCTVAHAKHTAHRDIHTHAQYHVLVLARGDLFNYNAAHNCSIKTIPVWATFSCAKDIWQILV